MLDGSRGNSNGNVKSRQPLYLNYKVILDGESDTMPNVVGKKGQVVISKKIRDELGVEPGWWALQSIVDNYVKIYFVPPEHNRSLMGSLAPYTDVVIQPGEEWDKAREKAWEAAAWDRVKGWEQDS